jgi:UTP--glucose-1-phosphate uridylyltransferase
MLTLHLLPRQMRAAELPQVFIDTFQFYYKQLVAGATGYIDHSVAGPVKAVPDYADLGGAEIAAGRAALDRTIVLKLNGGLGTSMGMDGPKSLLPGEGRAHLSRHHRAPESAICGRRPVRGVPLLLMNSFATRAASLAALARYPDFTKTSRSIFCSTWSQRSGKIRCCRRRGRRPG